LIVFKSASGLQDRAMTHKFSRRPLTTQARVRSRPRQLEIVMDMLALGQVSPKYFGFPMSVSIHYCPIPTWILKKDEQAKGKEKQSSLDIGKHWAEK